MHIFQLNQIVLSWLHLVNNLELSIMEIRLNIYLIKYYCYFHNIKQIFDV